MFKSCELIRIDNIIHYELIDSEFGKIVLHSVGGMYDAVIVEYARRNLNVVPNLMKAILWWKKRHGLKTPIQSILDYNMEYNYIWRPYKEDLQKYLALI